MQVASMHFKSKSSLQLDNAHFQKNMRRFGRGFAEKRAAAVAQLDIFEALRDAGKDIRNRGLENLDAYLIKFEEAATARGTVVHWAETAEDVNRIVIEIAQANGVKKIVKSKSMVSEESGLNHALEAVGIQAIETDLGEYIVQLAQEPPSHLIAPAIHKSKEDVAELFQQHHNLPYKLDIPDLTKEARQILRPHFLSADMGISGGNFLIAETGSVALVTNEGNGRMVTTAPKIHVAITGIEKVLPTLDELATIDAPVTALGDRPIDFKLRHGANRPESQKRYRRTRAIARDIGGLRPLRHARHRDARSLALHPLRRLHEPLPGVSEYWWSLLRLGVPRPDRGGVDAEFCWPRKCA